jgi:CBS domain-containing protein
MTMDEHSGENSNNLSSIFFDYELVFWLKLKTISNVVFSKTRIILYSLTLGNDALRKIHL